MFSINGGFYIPFFYFNPQPFLATNTQFLYPQTNIFQKSQNSFETTASLSPCIQIERKTTKEIDNSELYIPSKNQEKKKDFLKRKIIKKKIQKFIDQEEQAERLRRKLANRPKSYQTQKKMYLNADLSQLGEIEGNRRVLRKRIQHKRKGKILQDVNSKCEIELRSENSEMGKKLQQAEEQQTNTKRVKKIDRNLDFYNPEAQIPKLVQKTGQVKNEIEQKKLNLLSRKIQAKVNFFE